MSDMFAGASISFVSFLFITVTQMQICMHKKEKFAYTHVVVLVRAQKQDILHRQLKKKRVVRWCLFLKRRIEFAMRL